MPVKVVLCDINPKVIAAFRNSFEANPEVEIHQASMTEMQVSAWVTSINPAGQMDAGLGLVIKRFLGDAVEKRVQQEIRERHGGALQMGGAALVSSGRPIPRFLIAAPVVMAGVEIRENTLEVALACAAAFQAVHAQEKAQPGSIRSVALPGLGASGGRLPAETCADAMWTAYRLFRERALQDPTQMRVAVGAELGRLGSSRWKRFAAAAGLPTGAAGFTQDADMVDTADGEYDEDEVDTEDAEDDEAGGR